MDKPKLSDREAALVETAKRELAARTSPPAPASGPATRRMPEAAPVAESPTESPAPASSAGTDAAGRIAALMQAEKEETFRRKKRLRQFGIVIPALILIAAMLWVIAAIFRYARI
jgi:hypothetical protein